MELVNLTPHKINLHMGDGRFIVVPPSGDLARCEVKKTPSFPLSVLFEGSPVSIRTAEASYGSVEGLPAPSKDKAYLVSGMALEAVKKEGRRMDVFAPGDAIRDSEGVIIGCDGLKS